VEVLVDAVGGDGNGWDSDGWDSDGWDSDGWDSDGWDSDGWDSDGRSGGVVVEGRAAHQAPEVDGSTTLAGAGSVGLRPGDLVSATVVRADGVDLVAVPVPPAEAVP
jgi:hypothetical protein